MLRYLPHAEPTRQFATLCIINRIATTGIGEFFVGSIVEFDGHNKCVGVFIDELREARQRHHRRAKLAPIGSARKPTPNLPSVANGGFAPLGGAAATSVAALKTPVARGEGGLISIRGSVICS